MNGQKIVEESIHRRGCYFQIHMVFSFSLYFEKVSCLFIFFLGRVNTKISNSLGLTQVLIMYQKKGGKAETSLKGHSNSRVEMLQLSTICIVNIHLEKTTI